MPDKDTKKVDVYWKFTADKDYFVNLSEYGSADQGNSALPSVSILGDNNTLSELMGTTAADWSSKEYAFQKGKTYVFVLKDITAIDLAGFNLKLTEVSGAGLGLTESEPLTIKLGETQLFGNPNYLADSEDIVKVYTTYTAEKDGQLRITTEQRINNAIVNDEAVTAAYEGGKYIFKINTKAGETYKINFNLTRPFFVATSEVVQVNPGDLDMPFAIEDGKEISIPEAAGKYYLTYQPSKKGYLNITSDATLEGGQVKVFLNKLNASSEKNPAANSEIGSYNVRTEITSTYLTYYIVVDKKTATTAKDVIKAQFEDYQPGTTEDNPISVAVGSDITLPSAKGTYYYAITVPGNTNKFLVVEATSNVSDVTTVQLYKGSSWNAAKMENGIVKTAATGTAEATYTLKVVASEEAPLSFKVSYADIEAGSLATNPKAAVAGTNTFDFKGSEYYTYTATKDGKLAVTVGDDVEVRFPEEAGSYSTYDTYQKGNTFFIAATKGTSYLISITGNVNVGETFTLAETEFDKGEVRSNPIVMESSTYVFGDDAKNVWLKYNVTKDGIIDLASDIPFSWENNIAVAKGNNDGPVSMVNQDANYNSSYSAIFPVKAGEELYIQVNMNDDVKGKKLTLTQRDPEVGEAYSNPIVLEKGKTIDVSTAASNRALFVKANLKKGDNFFRLVGEGNIVPIIGCVLEANGITYAGSSAMWEEVELSDATTAYQFNVTAKNDMDCYIYINSVEGEPKLLFVDETTDGISDIEAAQQDGKVVIYNLNGMKVNQISGNGVYIIKSNGQTKKIVVKK